MKTSDDNTKDTLHWYIQTFLPSILGAIGAISVGICSYKNIVKNAQTIEKILDSTITFSSITVGFVGALLGILFSIRDTEAMKELFSIEDKDILKKYFKNNIITGIVLVFISLTLYIRKELDCILSINIASIKPSVIIFSIWGFMLLYMLASSYRITSIIMHMIFSNKINNNKELEGKNMNDTDKEKLKKRFKKQ